MLTCRYVCTVHRYVYAAIAYNVLFHSLSSHAHCLRDATNEEEKELIHRLSAVFGLLDQNSHCKVISLSVEQ